MSVESQRDTDIECSSQRMHVCAVCRTVSRSAEHGEGDDAQDRFHRSIVLQTELTSKRTSGRSADAEIWRCRGGTAERAERQIEARRSSFVPRLANEKRRPEKKEVFRQVIEG
jgi:hypothetical protein